MRTLDYLSRLVSFDTRNPPGGDSELLAYLVAELSRDQPGRPDRLESVTVEVGKHGYVAAFYGEPRRCINVHVDTVPITEGWTHPPLELTLSGDKAYGLGTADTKGNIAVLLDLLNHHRPQNAVLLFSGDEENAGSCCIRAFLQTPEAKEIREAIVCEPTDLALGVVHRGYVKFRLSAEGPGGHSSRANEMSNPLIDVCRMAAILDDVAKDFLSVGAAPFFGLCLNIGKISGGVAANVVPTRVLLEASLRPPPALDVSEFFKVAQGALKEKGFSQTILQVFAGPAFATREVSVFKNIFGDHFLRQMPLDFWTETALFADFGVNAVVFGPGSVTQAHAPDEFVKIEDLQKASDVYQSFLCRP